MTRLRKLQDAVVLLSGGMDSAVVLDWANRLYEQVHTLFFAYHQTTEEKEQECAVNLSHHYKVAKVNLVRLDYLSRISTSALLHDSRPKRTTDKPWPPFYIESDVVPDTYVPFRNSQFILMAAAYGESHNLRNPDILIGAAHGSVYPDCQLDYFKEMNRLLKLAGKPTEVPEVVTPLIHMNKQEIVARGISYSTPFELTWSCYNPGEFACGTCDSCKLRLEGFRSNNVKDPIEYISESEEAF